METITSGTISVGGTAISDGSSLAPFKSPTEIRPVAVHNWNVRLIGLKAGKKPYVAQVEYSGKFQLRLDYRQVPSVWRTYAQRIGFDQVVAIVSYDEPTEQVQQYAPYTLQVNGVTQPGGGGGATG